MDARTFGPGMGSLIVCSWICLSSLSVVQAQYPPAYYGPSAGAPVMVAPPAMMSPAMMAPGVMAPGVMAPGMMAPAGRRAVQPPAGYPASSASFSSSDAASRIPRLPFDDDAAAASLDSSSPAAVSAGSANGQSENFIVLCRDPRLTEAVSKAAEKYRRELAIHWFGQELPTWSRRCPIQVTAGPKLGAGGETRFALSNGNVGDWQMSVQGTPERILDSVLPHEITHTLLASHFAPLNVHVPRWADEGACTTVEHDSEQNKHKHMLVNFMQSGRAMSFNRMFSLKDYPSDILPLYAQGHSVVEFLIEQGGPRKFVSFLEQGMRTRQWEAAVREQYGYETLGKLQTQWNRWIADGRGEVDKFAGRPTPKKADPTSQDPPSLAMADDNVAEGARVELAGFKNVSAQDDEPAEVTLIAGDAEAPLAKSKKSDEDGFYRKRLESNLRSIKR